ncbi:MAG TPA: 2-C-methyl-D-erythritol 2,4-cyclodiphosphate synthase [Steroidobacteraceae bacterium]|nr:2-C-methyl-D-erythritol 2,4-cyclodiphosphate synthase [Steroidobacteraceae bacterium]
MSTSTRVGMGIDVHAFGPGDHLMLAGVRVPHGRGVLAHSDGDVVIHALCDALLGTAGLGDIGQHFPDSDPQWRGAASSEFLRRVVEMLTARGYEPVNVDITIVAQQPKIGPHREAMRHRLAELLGLDAEAVNVKATTTEQLGLIGRGEGIAALAVVLVDSIARDA